MNRNERLSAFLNGLDIDITILDYVCNDLDNITDYDSLYEALEDNGAFNQEVIYYANAIDYLKRNDPSLMESIELASDMGYDLKNITSEVLASLLASQYAREQFNELQGEIEEYFENELESSTDEL